MNNKKTSSMASDIVDAVRESTKKWTRTVKAEERSPASRTYRFQRMTRERRIEWMDVMTPVLMTKAYMKTSGNGRLPAKARQIMYTARPPMQKAAGGQELDDQYFTKVLLPKFLNENPELTAKWDIVFDARGHFEEPHTGFNFGLGTVEVREYLASLHDPKLIAAALKPAGIDFRGPSGSFGALLFIEKEGFNKILEAARIPERYDIAIMSTKGTSVTAARKLADEMCAAYDIPLVIARDFDKTGFSISGTLQRDTWRYTFQNVIEVKELGLSLDDVQEMGLETEYQYHKKGDKEVMIANMRENGASEAEIEFMFRDFDRLRSTRRVELNAMTSPQFVAFIERKLKAAGIKKIVPDKKELGDAYRAFVRGREAERIVKPALKKLEGLKVTVPRNLEQRVRAYLRKNPAQRWDAAVAAVVTGKGGKKKIAKVGKDTGSDDPVRQVLGRHKRIKG